MWIFFGLNSIYLLSAMAKFTLVQMSLENFTIFEDDILYWWNEVKLYVWDPDMREELQIEGYCEIAKFIVVIANYFIYW